MKSLREQLMRTTASAHTKIETTAFSLALREGRIPREAAASYLTCLSIIHAVLERSLSMSDLPQNKEIWKDSIPKLPLLLADLALITADKVKTIRPAVFNALELAAQIISTKPSVVRKKIAQFCRMTFVDRLQYES